MSPNYRWKRELKRTLKLLLLEAAQKDKLVIIATQSHLFLDKTQPEANYVARMENAVVYQVFLLAVRPSGREPRQAQQ